MKPIFDYASWLVISPHADDAELGCGGAIDRAVRDGTKVHVSVAVVKGEHQPHADGYVPALTREGELMEAMKVLGCDYDIVYSEPAIESNFDLCSSAKSSYVRQLDAIIDRLQPEVVLIPVPSFHQEHQWVFDCAMAATRITRHPSPVKVVAAYEYPPAGWGPSSAFDRGRGGVYVALSELNLETKLEALRRHVSQMYRGKDALISFEAVRALARLRGIEAGTTNAELLHLMRAVV